MNLPNIYEPTGDIRLLHLVREKLAEKGIIWDQEDKRIYGLIPQITVSQESPFSPAHSINTQIILDNGDGTLSFFISIDSEKSGFEYEKQFYKSSPTTLESRTPLNQEKLFPAFTEVFTNLGFEVKDVSIEAFSDKGFVWGRQHDVMYCINTNNPFAVKVTHKITDEEIKNFICKIIQDTSVRERYWHPDQPIHVQQCFRETNKFLLLHGQKPISENKFKTKLVRELKKEERVKVIVDRGTGTYAGLDHYYITIFA